MRIRKYVETYILCSREYTSPPSSPHATPVLIVSRTFLHYAREREREGETLFDVNTCNLYIIHYTGAGWEMVFGSNFARGTRGGGGR